MAFDGVLIITKSSNNTDSYIAKLKAIRSYTDGFGVAGGYDIRKAGQWNSAQKAAITRYYNLVKSLSTQPHYIYRPRKKENLNAAKRAMSAKSFNKLKVGIIQVPSRFDEAGKLVIEKPKIRVNKKGQLKVKVKDIRRDPIIFEDYDYDDSDFALSPESFVDEMLEDISDYKMFSIMAGEHEVGQGNGVVSYFTKDQLPGEVTRLMNKYNADIHDPDDSSSSYYGNWLRGFIGYNFDNIGDYREYENARDDYRKFFLDNKEQIRKLNNNSDYYRKRIKTLNRKKKISIPEKRKLLNKYNNKIKSNQNKINKLILERIKK